MKTTFDKFEGTLAELRERPVIRFSTKKRELQIEYATVWPTADEFDPDSLMMKVGTFRRSFLKLVTFLKMTEEKFGAKIEFDFARLISDIKNLEAELPKTLDQLAEIYLTSKGKQEIKSE